MQMVNVLRKLEISTSRCLPWAMSLWRSWMLQMGSNVMLHTVILSSPSF